MSIAQNLSALALRPLVDAACKTLGLQTSEAAADAAQHFLVERFTDHSLKLTAALETANQRAWKALELALAGDSWWDKARALVARGDEKALARQVQAFLASSPLPEFDGRAALRSRCLQELRAAGSHAVLQGRADRSATLRQAADFARHGEPQKLIDAELRTIAQIAVELETAGFKALGWLLKQRPAQGAPLLVVLVRYFFRREVETDAGLFRGLVWERLDQVSQTQEAGFAALADALAQHGDRLETLLTDVHAVAVEARDGVRRVEAELQQQKPQLAKIDGLDEKVARLELVVAQLPQQLQLLGQDVQKVLVAKKLSQRVVRPRDSVSLRSDGERRLVRALVQRYRELPAEQRQAVPALLNAVGKLEVLVGDLDDAQKDFQTVTTLVDDPKSKAEAHYNAYQAALERGDWDKALSQLLGAVRLDATRFAPFLVGKYTPQRILGAGGFGVAFLCKHKYMDGPVVVKALRFDDLDRGSDEVFAEAQALRQLDHPGIIRIQDCGYVDGATRSRPYFVMDYFAGRTLEAHVAEHGPLSPDDLIFVARSVAEALHAAHRRGILHRDVKPANLLVLPIGNETASTWETKLIDFGLALGQDLVQSTLKAAGSKRKTILGQSIAGTIDYAAPEQMGKLPGVSAGTRSDVYGFGKTCCFALFGTPQPTFQHWRRVPEPLADLLGRCIMEDPAQRPAGFAEVLEQLAKLTGPSLKVTAVGPARPEPVAPVPAPPVKPAAAATKITAKPPAPKTSDNPFDFDPTLPSPSGGESAPPPPSRRRGSSTLATVGQILMFVVGLFVFLSCAGLGALAAPEDPLLGFLRMGKFALALAVLAGGAIKLLFFLLSRASADDLVPAAVTALPPGCQFFILKYVIAFGLTIIIVPIILIFSLINHRKPEPVAVNLPTPTVAEPEPVRPPGRRPPATRPAPADLGEAPKPNPKVRDPLPAATFAGPDVSPDWRVLFRSADPSIWGKKVDRDENDMARPLADVPDDVRYLRIRKGDDFVIIEMTPDRLAKCQDDGRFGWEGTNHDNSGGLHLGIFDTQTPSVKKGDICIRIFPWLRGWGFGHIHFMANVQGYCWAGKSIEKTVFEIALSPGPLTAREAKKLLSKNVDQMVVDDPKPEPKVVDPLPASSFAALSVSPDWRMLFRSADPSIWGKDIQRKENDCARALDAVPADIAYVRLRREDDYIILPMTKPALSKCGGEKRYGWNGTAALDWQAHHLGVYVRYWVPREVPPTVVVSESPQAAGWGFGARYGVADKQGYTWAGKELPRTVFEIAVKSGELTEAESRKVLKAGSPRIGAAAAPKEEGGWQVLFRSSDPSIWNDDVQTVDHFATALEVIPEGVLYLRLTNMKSKDYVIVEMTNEQLVQRKDNGKIGWEGVNSYEAQGHHLGVYSKAKVPPSPEPWVAVCGHPQLRGWGFGPRIGGGDAQGYSWNGREIARTVFEIAVKRDDLTKAEKVKLLLQ